MTGGAIVARVRLAVRGQLGPGCVPVREYLRARAQGQTEIENRFFAGLRLRSGVFKTTGSTRLAATVAPLVRHARTLSVRPLRVLDVGCSSGEATVALHEALADAGLDPATWGTDVLTHARHVFRVDGCGLLFDPNDEAIQVDIGSWATSWFWPPRKVDLVRRPYKVARAMDILHRQTPTFRAALSKPVDGMTVTEVPLVSSRVDTSTAVKVVEEDLTVPAVPGVFNVIRAGNILNRVYFTEDRLRVMSAAVVSRLADGGILLVIRSEGGVNRGTFYQRQGNRLNRIEDVNGGSEVAHLIPARTTQGER